MKYIFSIFILFAFYSNANAQLKTWWYKDGVADSVFFRTDIFSFRALGGNAYTGSYNTSVIDSINYHPDRRDKANEVFFNPSSTLTQRVAEAQAICATGQVEIIYINVCRDLSANFSTQKLYTIDNLLHVSFIDANPSATDIANFASQFGLTLYSAPLAGLPINTVSPSYSYTFETPMPQNNVANFDIDYLANLLQGIYNNSTLPVYNVSPNLIMSYPRQPDIPTKQIDSISIRPNLFYNTCSNNSINDYYADYQWYIDNQGYNNYDISNQVDCSASLPDAKVGADAKICGCWQDGHFGKIGNTRILVGVIAPGDINFLNADIVNKQDFIPAWDCTGPTIDTLISVAGVSNGSLSEMCGIIGAELNNGGCIAGIAPESKIIPYKIGNTVYDPISTGNIIKALERSLIDNVDVLAMDVVMEIEDLTIRDWLNKHHVDGRARGEAGEKFGTIIVAPAGYTNTLNTFINTQPVFPAKYNYDSSTFTTNRPEPEVIGVIGSDKDDSLAVGERYCNEPFDSTAFPNAIYPSRWNSTYDVACPAYSFWSISGGGCTRDFTGAYQNALTTAITAGVCALVLEEHYDEYDTIFARGLRNGCDKVGGYNYTGLYNKSPQLAAGRINCKKTLDNWVLGLNNVNTTTASMVCIGKNNSWDIVSSNKNLRNINIEVYNELGSLVHKMFAPNSQQAISINCANFASGIYFIKINSGKFTKTLKAIK